jgi:anti-sigma factor ChrR (cupin superfamily)
MMRKKKQSSPRRTLRPKAGAHVAGESPAWSKEEAALAWAAPVAAAPSAKVKTQLLARIRATQAAAPTAGAAVLAGWRFESVGAQEGWREAFPGVRIKTLSVDEGRDVVMLLLAMTPGARFPDHVHDEGGDEGVVISGDVVMDGRTMGAGDYYHAAEGTHHLNITSPSGCTALLSMRASVWRKWRERIAASR